MNTTTGSLQAIRTQIEKALGVLIDDQGSKHDAMGILKNIDARFMRREHIFSTESILYSHLVKMALSPEFQSDRAALIAMRDELKGLRTWRKSYAFRYNFVELLMGEFAEAYHIAEILFTQYTDGRKIEDQQNEEERRYEVLYSLTDTLQPATIHELVVLHISHLVLILPDTGEADFDISDSPHYATIYPIPTTESVDSQLDYLEQMFLKMRGVATLFVNIYGVSEDVFLVFR